MSSRTEQIRQAVAEFLVPMVEREGGEIYLTSIQEREISIHLAGRYAGSPAASLLYQELILPLVEAVAPGTIVHWSSGRVIPRTAVRTLPPVSSPPPDDTCPPDAP